MVEFYCIVVVRLFDVFGSMNVVFIGWVVRFLSEFGMNNRFLLCFCD